MSGMFSSGGTSTSTTSPWAPQQPSIQRTFDTANQLADKGPPQFFPGQLVAGRNKNELAAQNSLTGYAAKLPGIQAGLQGSGNDIMGQFLNSQAKAQSGINDTRQQAQFGLNAPNLESNPYLASYMQAADRPLQQNLNENIIPQTRLGSINAGQAGSSRAGIAEGLAGGRTQQAIGDTNAKIASDAYNQGLNTYSNTLNLLPQLSGQELAMGGQNLQSLAIPQFQAGVEQQFGTMPGEIQSALGTNQRQFDQSNIDAQRQKFEFQQLAPWLLLSLFQGATSGNFGGTVQGENDIKGPKNGLDPLGMFGGSGLGGLFGGGNGSSGSLGGMLNPLTSMFGGGALGPLGPPGAFLGSNSLGGLGSILNPGALFSSIF